MPLKSHYSYSSRPRTGRPSNGGGSRYGGGASRGRPAKKFIHPSKFIRSAQTTEQVQYQAKHTFADFALHPLVKTNVTSKGFITPSPIQDQTIAHALNGSDIIGIANTGTGKTAAFALPLLTKLMEDKNNRALVIAPTRELAEQIEVECRSFAKTSGLFGALLIGGSSMPTQIRELRANPSLVIGTPGRILDHIKRGNLALSTFNMVVLDEVDRMVDMGFIKDIRQILGQIATKRQSLFFSATLDPSIESLVNSFLVNPITISVKTGDTSENVEQNIIEYRGTTQKMEKLHEVLINGQVAKALIFDETQRDVEKLSNELLARGFKADAIHGGKTQGHRQRALAKFRNNDISILVATDVAARGIDITDITHVINYTTPQTYDDYVHRIGRAGRAGKTGNALTFVSQMY